LDFLLIHSGRKDEGHRVIIIETIIPIRPLETRQQRIAMKIEMDLQTLLSTYFDSKPELVSKKSELIEKALALQAEYESEKDA